MADITAQILTEIRDEGREARAETRENFKTVFHRLGLLEAGTNDVKQRLTSVEQRLTSVERHMAALLDTVPVMNERIDRLEARVAALEAHRP